MYEPSSSDDLSTEEVESTSPSPPKKKRKEVESSQTEPPKKKKKVEISLSLSSESSDSSVNLDSSESSDSSDEEVNVKPKSKKKKVKKDIPKLSGKVSKGYEKYKQKCKHSDSVESASAAKAKKARSKSDMKIVEDVSEENDSSKGDEKTLNVDDLRTISSGKSITIPAEAFQSLIDFVRYVKYM